MVIGIEFEYDQPDGTPAHTVYRGVSIYSRELGTVLFNTGNLVSDWSTASNWVTENRPDDICLMSSSVHDFLVGQNDYVIDELSGQIIDVRQSMPPKTSTSVFESLRNSNEVAVVGNDLLLKEGDLTTLFQALDLEDCMHLLVVLSKINPIAEGLEALKHHIIHAARKKIQEQT